jgi:hypothetical protein
MTKLKKMLKENFNVVSMSNDVQLIKISEYPSQKIEKLKSIFWESSVKTDFESEKKKSEFEYKYFDFYVKYFPHLSFAIESDNHPIGYLLGADQTTPYLDQLEMQKYVAEFEDIFATYPAHFHINLSENARGKGCGQIALQELFKILTDQNCPGVHVITALEHPSQKFYEKNGLAPLKTMKISATQIVILVKSL